MTAEDVIERARKRLKDTSDQSYRWTNDELLDYLNDGHHKMLTDRPEIHTDYETTGQSVTPRSITSITALTDTLEIQDRHANSLAHFIVSQALQNDNLDAANAERSAVSNTIHEGELRSK